MAYAVAPYAGAWIEIFSLNVMVKGCPVAPLAGAWIEMRMYYKKYIQPHVAPLAGAWIEIWIVDKILSITRSLPSRERGLKF